MSLAPNVCLVHTLKTLCDDVFFAIASTNRLDEGGLRALGKRRASVIQAAARGAPPELLTKWETWLPRLCAAMAPIDPPRFLAMADVIDEGISLEGGARGVRSLFTSKPSEKDVARVKMQGTFAARVLASVLGATGNFHPEARAQRGCFLVSLGLSDEETKALVIEEPLAAEAVEVPEGLPPKIARAVLRGAFFAAMLEGVDPREEQAVLTIGKKTGLPKEEITEAHGEARKRIDDLRVFGPACVDALRYVLEGEKETSDELAVAAARMTLPMSYRNEAITAVNVGGKVALTKKHTLDRKSREAALGLAWAGALRLEPTYVRRIELALRHDEVAKDLGDENAGRETRRIIEGFVEEQMREVAPLVPPPMV